MPKMSAVIKVYDRNPHVLKKLIRFTGYIPANLVDKSKNLITPVKISLQEREKVLQAGDSQIDISFEGTKHHTRILKIHMDEANKDIEEIKFVILEEKKNDDF